MQVANLFVCRSPTLPVLAQRRSGNRLIWIGLAAEVAIILAIVYTPLGNVLIGTTPLPPGLWLVPVPFALALLVLEDLRKWLARRRPLTP